MQPLTRADLDRAEAERLKKINDQFEILEEVIDGRLHFRCAHKVTGKSMQQTDVDATPLALRHNPRS